MMIMAQTPSVTAVVCLRTEAEVKAEALREVADMWYSDDGPWSMHGSEATWLRQRADSLHPTAPRLGVECRRPGPQGVLCQRNPGHDGKHGYAGVFWPAD
jgi:hypothetical protein